MDAKGMGHPNGGGLQNLEGFIIHLCLGATEKMADSSDIVAPKVGRRVLASNSIKLREMGPARGDECKMVKRIIPTEDERV